MTDIITEAVMVNGDQAPIAVIYHAHCNDGYMSAWIIAHSYMTAGGAKHMRPSHISLIPWSYGDGESALLDELNSFGAVYVVDMSLAVTTMRSLTEIVGRVFWVDHHASAEHLVPEYKALGLSFVFDKSHSACELTRIMMGLNGQQIELASMLIEDRDLWKFEHDDTKAFHAGLCAINKTYSTWCDAIYGGDGCSDIINNGRVILASVNNRVAQYRSLQRRVDIYIDGQHVRALAVNGDMLIRSELGQDMLDQHADIDVAIVFWRGPEGWHISIRSDNTSLVSARQVAEFLGGGGHERAAAALITEESMPYRRNYAHNLSGL